MPPPRGEGGGAGTPHDGLYGYITEERVGISLVEVIINKRVGKSVIWVCEKARKG